MKTFELGEICYITTGQSAPQDTDAFGEVGKPFIRAGSLESLISGKNESSLELISEGNAKKYKLKLFTKNTILFAKSGMSATLGRVYKTKADSYIVSHLAAITPSESVDSNFLLRWFQKNPPSRLIENAAYPSIKTSEIAKLKITLPPLEEQKRIAAILDKADAIRRKRQEAIKLADEFLHSVFLDMFGDPVTNPKDWEVKKLKELVSKIGSGSTPKGGKESYLDEGISLIRSLNIHDNQFRYKDLAFISDQQANKLANVIVEKNDVLLNITGASVCRCTIVPEKVLPARVNQHVAIIRPKSISPIYLLHLLISKSYKHKLLLLSGSGATREALTKEQIENLEIPCPPGELQSRFQAIENKVSELTSQLKIFSSDELFNSLSQKAFSR